MIALLFQGIFLRYIGIKKIGEISHKLIGYKNYK